MTEVWDKTTPLGTEAISLGDDRIREAKSALESALSHEGTFPGASPSTAPIFIPGFLRDTTANRPTGDDLVDKRFFCNTTLNVLERYNGASWDAVATLIPSGTKMLFYQAAAPTGWTAVALNDKFLRVVSAGGTGGSSGGSGQTPSAGTNLAHTHTVAGHTHTIAHKHTTPVSADGVSGLNVAKATTWTEGVESLAEDHHGISGSFASSTLDFLKTKDSDTANSGSATPATDSQLATLTYQYADVIVASKD